MMSTNMQIWEKVSTTDTRYTKAAEVGGQKITSLNGTAMIMKATEVFGPVGIGFGWSVMEERFDEGSEMISGEGDKRLVLGRELNHTIKIRFWFELDGKRGEIEQYGCTRYLYKSKYGTTTDGEAPKKSLTDAIKKSLSMLGFSADVFLGMFDDTGYVEQLKDEERLEDAADKDAEILRQKQERLDWLNSAVETIGKAVTLYELKTLNVKYIREATRRNEPTFIARITRAFEERKSALEQGKEKAA
ncbi:hypothetical protein [Pseudomonas lini]|uniref:Rad52/22 family double-strand break repair protein n=1 Tax=Pseudomonas lini TaxID=163011 RepID=A0A0J6HD68_9PSED|nr:hypothetical protein [Pseudomonas lini]KAB0502806.1 hypothetical protein F7R14_19430 [Pseudomonas lini]KMM94916.1 hypothetical protein TU81_00330 [Pseudomonas lini]SDT21208.1 hypothetical protein SAMN04490191_3514 [Pseudomonas lini]